MAGYIKHLQSLSPIDLGREIENKISDNFPRLVDEDAVSSAMAETNATGWGMETYTILDKPEELDLTGNTVDVRISCEGSGEQDEDKPWCGDAMEVEATAIIDDNGGVDFEDVTPSLNWPDEDDLRDAAASNQQAEN